MNLQMKKQEDFIGIYQKYVDTVYRICYMYCKNKNDTEDAVQTTFTKLLETNKTFETEDHIKAWLIVTASNICKNSLKHWYRKILDITQFEEKIKTPSNQKEELKRLILELPDRYKTIIYMYYYEGYNSREIARFLGKKESTIRTYLKIGRERLKENLGGK